VAALCQLVFGRGVEAAIHFMLALGSGFLCSAIRDFNTPQWAAWLGAVSTGLLAGIFGLQGISDLSASTPLARVAFQVLGQNLEGWLTNGLILWCIAAMLAGSHGKTRILGFVALSLTVAARAYAIALSFGGVSVETTAPGVKLLYLLPFLWLLLEASRAKRIAGATR
jgi:hypothetical protein